MPRISPGHVGEPHEVENLIDLGSDDRAGTPEHFREVLVEGRADAALAASLFHFGNHTIAEVKAYLAERGVEVRP